MSKKIDLTDCMTPEEFSIKMHEYLHEQGEIIARRVRKDREELEARKHKNLITK